jgi:RNA polymerase sigma factor (sigma-70 family)
MEERPHIVLEQLNDLIQGCINRERFAQNKLYEVFAPKMMVVCLRYSKNREEAEEILQEGFMRVFNFIQQFNFNGSFEGWMRKIMVNCALQRLRNKSNLNSVVNIETVNIEHSSYEDIVSQIGTKELLKMVQLLPPSYKLVFNLYVFEGMKHREISALLGITEGTSKSNLSDARVILQKAVFKSMAVAKQKSNSV